MIPRVSNLQGFPDYGFLDMFPPGSRGGEIPSRWRLRRLFLHVPSTARDLDIRLQNPRNVENLSVSNTGSGSPVCGSHVDGFYTMAI